MKALTLILCATLMLAITTKSQDLVWAKQLGGASNDEGHAIALDSAGNIFTTGYFEDTVDFDPGAGTFNLISAGDRDIFISKLDASGNFVWAKQLGGTGRDIGRSISVDNNGNIYTTGSFRNVADFDPGAGTFNLTSAGIRDVFISKLDASGNFVWTKQLGGLDGDKGSSISVDGSGNVYTTGGFQGTADFDPGAGTFNLTSAGSQDIFISKLDPSGNFVWAKQLGGASNDFGESIALDDMGNIYTTGDFWGTADFDPGASTYNLATAGVTDIFISKLDASGNFVWAKQLGGTNEDYCLSIAVDGSGNVYTTGSFRDVADFDPGAGTFNLTSAGGSDVFISKLDDSGNFIWAKQFGGTNFEYGLSIAVDDSGNVYTAGWYEGTADFDPGAGTFNLTSAGGADVFISKLDTSGNFAWAKQLGGTGFVDRGNSVAVDDIGNVYTTGWFEGTVDFDPGAGNFNLTSTGNTDIFVHKMGSCNNSSSQTITACDSYTWIDGVTYTSDNNTATHTLTNTAGCDSVVNLDLTINYSSTGTDIISTCDSYTWIDGNTYTTSNNTAIHTLTNAAGCDSVVSLDLTINYSNTGIDVINTCDSYTWIDGNTYTASNNTATHTLTNEAGCDSVVTLDLTINNNTGTDIISACDSYTWIDGITYTSSNITATDTLTNAAGCDSVITLDLTIMYSTTSTDIVNACDSHTWIDGNTYTGSNNMATHTLTNAAGCDSVVTLYLTINSVDNSVSVNDLIITANASGASYQWLNCEGYTAIPGETNQKFTATSNGEYAVVVTQNGCTDTSSCSTISTIGIIENSFGSSLAVFPNPTTGNLSIELEEIHKNVQLTVKNITGQVVLSKKYENPSKLSFALERPSGVYLLYLTAGKDGTAVVKVVKE